MVSAEDAFRGVRPSDLRYDNIHVLAEYIGQAQRLIDAAAATNAESKQLLSTSLRIAKENTRRSEQAGVQLGLVLDAKKSELMQGLDSVTAALVTASKTFVAKTADAVKAPAATIAQAAAELLAASAAAEGARERAGEERRRLAEFKAEVSDYLEDVMAHERESLRRITEAQAGMYANAGFWKRVQFVFRPPRASVHLGSAPRRPPLKT